MIHLKCSTVSVVFPNVSCALSFCSSMASPLINFSCATLVISCTPTLVSCRRRHIYVRATHPKQKQKKPTKKKQSQIPLYLRQADEGEEGSEKKKLRRRSRASQIGKCLVLYLNVDPRRLFSLPHLTRAADANGDGQGGLP